MDEWKPIFDVSGKETEQELVAEQVYLKLVETMWHGIIHLVNTRDTQRLIALQQVTNELYRRADICMAAGKDMGVSDQVD